MGWRSFSLGSRLMGVIGVPRKNERKILQFSVNMPDKNIERLPTTYNLFHVAVYSFEIVAICGSLCFPLQRNDATPFDTVTEIQRAMVTSSRCYPVASQPFMFIHLTLRFHSQLVLMMMVVQYSSMFSLSRFCQKQFPRLWGHTTSVRHRIRVYYR